MPGSNLKVVNVAGSLPSPVGLGPHAPSDGPKTVITGLGPADARKTENPPAATPVQRVVSQRLLGV
jgi:hypothetical protein